MAPPKRSAREVGIHRWVAASSGVAQERVRWSDDVSPWPSTKDGEWVSLRDMGDDSTAAWVEYRERVVEIGPVTIQSIDGASGQFLAEDHGLQTGDGPVRLTGTAPTGFTGDLWAIRASASRVRFATSFVRAMDGLAIEVVDSGTPPLAITSTAHTVRAGAELTQSTHEMGALEISVQVRGTNAMAVMRRFRIACQAPQFRSLLHSANVGLLSVGPVQNVGAALNAGNYEPRAAMTIRLSIGSVHTDTITVIESADVEADVSGSLD